MNDMLNRKRPQGAMLTMALLAMLILTTMAHASDKGVSLAQVEKRYHEALKEEAGDAEKALNKDPRDRATALRLARAWYFLGLADDADYSRQAQVLLTRLHREDPDDAVAQVYLGSCLMLQSARTWKFWAKQSLADQGLVLLDQAVDRAPDDAEIRFIRAATTHHLPFWFDRATQSREDFAHTAPLVEQAVVEGQLPDWMGAAILFHHAENLHRHRASRQQAREVFQQAAQLAPESPAGAAAAHKLE